MILLFEIQKSKDAQIVNAQGNDLQHVRIGIDQETPLKIHYKQNKLNSNGHAKRKNNIEKE
jgi:hypothetical protein